MANLTAIKKQVKQKLKQARLRKQQSKRKDNDTCNHTWQRFKQTVQPEERTRIARERGRASAAKRWKNKSK